MSVLRQRWEALAPREQRVLAGGAGVLVALLSWTQVWEPLAQSRDDARVRALAAEADLAWMRAAAPQVRERIGLQPAFEADSRSLLARVDASAREAGLGSSLLRVDPVASGQVRVTFERVGFDPLMRWVELLAQRYGTRATEMSVQRADGVGLVDARLSLEEGAR